MTSDTSQPAAAPANTRSPLVKWGRRLLIVALVGLLATMLFTRWVAGTADGKAVVQSLTEPAQVREQQELVVFSVNCAHGRGEGMHQLLTSSETLRANCQAIGELLKSRGADIVCMQECDAASWWSGRFNHAEAIGSTAELPYLVHALNVDGAGLHYGTAVLSQLQLTNGRTGTFRPTPPTFSKGFAIAEVSWPGDAAFKFDVVAVHLDFASSSARAAQVEQLVAVIKARANPVVIVGDLNCNWSASGATQQLTKALDLSAFEPESEMITFPFTNDRLDWVLVSKDLQIKSVEAIDAKLSDHRPLRAVIRRAE